MKVLIPTEDCLTIAQNFDKANSFRLMTIINGCIKEDSFITSSVNLRDKYPFGLKELGEIDMANEKEPNTADKSKINNTDLFVVLAGSVSKETEKILLRTKYEVFHTSEINIINALNVYINEKVKKESDYCCQP